MRLRNSGQGKTKIVGRTLGPLRIYYCTESLCHDYTPLAGYRTELSARDFGKHDARYGTQTSLIITRWNFDILTLVANLVDGTYNNGRTCKPGQYSQREHGNTCLCRKVQQECHSGTQP